MPKKYKILVADDSQEVQKAVIEALKNENYKLNIVSTPEDAINYEKQYDLLLTDFYFGKGKKAGLNVIKELKEKRKNLAAILMTSGLNDCLIDKCKKLNVGSFKKFEDDKTPVDEIKLRETISSYLSNY